MGYGIDYLFGTLPVFMVLFFGYANCPGICSAAMPVRISVSKSASRS